MKNPFFKKPKNDYDSYDAYDSGFYRGDEEEDEGVVGDGIEDDNPPLPPKRPTAGSSNMLKVYKPMDYQDGPVIADYLMDGYTVVMNIEELERSAVMRLIDFLLGVIHVLDGDMRRVTKTTLVLTPRKGEVSGDEDNDN
ncbi:MAG: cell division protein SepF [Clostridia bacterium]|nr:cell division protein SepF [Clostridia bacterium]